MNEYFVIRKVKVQKKCIGCKGTGISKNGEKQCSYCGGNGYTVIFRTTEIPLMVALADLQNKQDNTLPDSSLIDKVIETVCDHYQISRDELFDHRRNREIVELRYLVFKFIRTEFQLTYKDIGHKFGGFDHTTVRRGQYEIEAWTKNDKLFAKKYNNFNSLVKSTLNKVIPMRNNNV